MGMMFASVVNFAARSVDRRRTAEAIMIKEWSK